MTKPRIICWDLDETLGSFRDIISARSGGTFPNPDNSYTLRKDIIKALNRMLDKGYRHVITSSAKYDYSEKVLKAVCLDAYFDHVFGRKEVTDGIWGKKYLPAANSYDMDETEALSNILVVANMASDEPIDLEVVFIHDERELDETALDYEAIADALWSGGEGSFKRGFERLFEAGRRMACLDREFNFMLVSARINQEIAVDMGYKNSACTEGLKIPTIFNIRPI